MQTSDGPATGQYGDRIARGAAFLDKYIPDWRSRIDTEALDISGLRCVLFQLNAWELFDEDESVEPYGFFLTGPAAQGYPQLTQEWKQYIEATR